MRLSRVYFRGFGRWVDQAFSLKNGINLIEAPNEAGKSTLIDGLFALLYGAKKENKKQQKKMDWYEDYLPWQGSAYGGEVDFFIGEKEYRLIRSLTWKKDIEQLIDVKTGRDLTMDFPLDKRKDRQFIYGLTGFSRNLFIQTTYFSSRLLADDQELVEKLRELMGEKTWVNPVLNRLEKEINQIGIKTVGSKEYAQAVQKRDQLQQEMVQKQRVYEKQQQARKQLADLEYQQKTLDASKKEITREKRKCLTKKEAAQKRISILRELSYLKNDWKQGEEIRKNLTSMREKREKLVPPVLLSEEEAEEVRALLQRCHQLSEEAKEIIIGIEETKQTIHQLKSEKESFLELDIESIVLLRNQLERVEQMESELHIPHQKVDVDEIKRIQMDGQMLRSLERQKEEAERKRERLEQEKCLIQERKEAFMEALHSFASRFLRLPILLGVFLTGCFLFLFLLKPWPLVGGLLLVGCLLVAFRVIRGMRAQKTKQTPNNIDHLQQQLEEIIKDIQAVQIEKETIREKEEAIFRHWNVDSAASLGVMATEKAADLKQWEQIQSEVAEIQNRALPFMDRLGDFDLFRWKVEIKTVEQEAKEAQEQLYVLSIRLEHLKKHKDQLDEDWKRLEREMNRWRETLTEDVEVWEDWIQRSRSVYRLDEKIEELVHQSNEWEQKRQNEEWDKQQNDLQNELNVLESLLKEEDLALDPETLEETYANRLKELSAQIRYFESKQYELEGRINRLKGELNQSGDHFLGNVKTMLQEARNRVEELEWEREVLQATKEGIQEAAQHVQDNIAPLLHPYASRCIREVTKGRYGELKVDPSQGFALRVFVPETGESKPVEQLSKGTMDQMFFALRLALIRFFSDHGSIRLPLILDDSLIHFDESRLQESINLLGQMAQEHQVILCTCQDRERRILEAEGIPYTDVLFQSVPPKEHAIKG